MLRWILFFFLGMIVSPSGCHSLWQIYCNLQSPDFHHDCEQLGLYTVVHESLVQCLLFSNNTNHCNPYAFLWTPCHQLFHLWDPGPIEANLLSHSSHIYSGYDIFTVPLPFTFILISYVHTDYGYHTEDLFCRGQIQIVVTIFYGTAIYMYLKTHSRGPKTRVKSSLNFMVLHLLEGQGCERCPKKNN